MVRMLWGMLWGHIKAVRFLGWNIGKDRAPTSNPHMPQPLDKRGRLEAVQQGHPRRTRRDPRGCRLRHGLGRRNTRPAGSL